MNSFLAKCIGFSLLIVSISVAYYLIIYLPKRNQTFVQQQGRLEQGAELSNKQKCVTAGEKFYKEDLASTYGSLSQPTYYYNKKLNTCLYSIQETSTWTEDDRSRFPQGCVPYSIKVVDSLTREKLLELGQNGPTCQTYPISKDEFDKQYQVLFSQ